MRKRWLSTPRLSFHQKYRQNFRFDKHLFIELRDLMKTQFGDWAINTLRHLPRNGGQF